jgi:hypothetical protein
MTDKPHSPTTESRAEREKRLAAALRENLRRRKAQARGRQSGAGDAAGGAPSGRDIGTG